MEKELLWKIASANNRLAVLKFARAIVYADRNEKEIDETLVKKIADSVDADDMEKYVDEFVCKVAGIGDGDCNMASVEIADDMIREAVKGIKEVESFYLGEWRTYPVFTIESMRRAYVNNRVVVASNEEEMLDRSFRIISNILDDEEEAYNLVKAGIGEFLAGSKKKKALNVSKGDVVCLNENPDVCGKVVDGPLKFRGNMYIIRDNSGKELSLYPNEFHLKSIGVAASVNPYLNLKKVVADAKTIYVSDNEIAEVDEGGSVVVRDKQSGEQKREEKYESAQEAVNQVTQSGFKPVSYYTGSKPDIEVSIIRANKAVIYDLRNGDKKRKIPVFANNEFDLIQAIYDETEKLCNCGLKAYRVIEAAVKKWSAENGESDGYDPLQDTIDPITANQDVVLDTAWMIYDAGKEVTPKNIFAKVKDFIGMSDSDYNSEIAESIKIVLADNGWQSLKQKEKQEQNVEKVAAGWEKLPKGWTEESLKKFWNSLTGNVKHKTKKCIRKFEGIVDDPGAFCASLRDRVEGTTKWRGSSTENS